MTRILFPLVLALLLAAVPAQSADHSGHGDHAMPTDHSAHGDHAMPMDHSAHGGHQMASPEEMQKRMMQWIPKAEAKVGSKIDPALSFLDGDGKKRTMGEFFDKPLFVTFVFATCPHICPTITGNLAARVGSAMKAKKGDFRTLVISFDTASDTPAAMKAYAAGFLESPSFVGGVADKGTVGALTEAFGFSFMPHPTETWAHITMVTAVDAGGVITRHIFGTKVPADEFNEALDGLLTPAGK